ncbi:MAG: phosphonate ABC transporter substrate-binding protein [Hoeflea sp.]|uniref:phosphonate ABC transporter substrate-binding protein n=1 Tax=Hoeflea sp. TaxID=1940281 RepID=UPI0027306C9F|nr:phosphonate ABC transporter substrate-binding protein [Hoeflea sp.]MDP2122467.1 phosphonate ABC transporter substrate-binding protein [Hoeflea sp.]
MMKTILAAATIALLSTSVFAQDAITEFRIGILGGENAQDRMTSNECVRAYVQDLLGVETKLFTPADYDGVIQGLLGGSIDMAWLGASAYAKAYLTNPEALDVVLVKTNLDGSVGYYSIGFARKDKEITSLADMKGKVFAFGDPNSTSGYLIPSVEIPAEIGATMTSGDYFGEVKFVGGHEQTIVAVNNGEVDAGVTWADGQGNWEDGYNSGALRKAVDSGLVDMNDLVEIWRSKEIPEGPIVLRRALPDDVKQKVVTFLSELHGKDKQCAYNMAAGETSGFTPISHDAYESIINVRKAQSN